MYSCCSGREGYHPFIVTYDLLEFFFKTVYIRAKGYNPIGFKCLIHKLLLVATQMAETEKNSFFSSFHNYIFKFLLLQNDSACGRNLDFCIRFIYYFKSSINLFRGQNYIVICLTFSRIILVDINKTITCRRYVIVFY